MTTAHRLLAAACLLLAAAPALAQDSGPLGLTVSLDRPAPVYAFRDPLYLTIQTRRDAAVTIRLLDPAGNLTQVTPEGLPLLTKAGVPQRYPKTGVLRVERPAGRYELRVSAETPGGEGRSLTDASSRLPGRDVHEQKVVGFQVEDPDRR